MALQVTTTATRSGVIVTELYRYTVRVRRGTTEARAALSLLAYQTPNVRSVLGLMKR